MATVNLCQPIVADSGTQSFATGENEPVGALSKRRLKA
jgi:hypothetical protein